ncbi:TonB-dependent receptor [Flavobacterium aquidurense]|uniref:TonB-dependent receptor n=1 Tax=Flavobacterium aquidurense TaxID=362413 RepID=UPI0037226CDB
MKTLLQQHRSGLFLLKALMLYLGFCTQMTAQQTIKGRVTDQNNEPLFGVSIAVKGTNKGANTDVTGEYAIEVKANATLIFNYIGFKSKQVVITTQKTVDVSLEEDTQALDEIVVTGVFDKRTKMQSSVSISTLSAKQIERVATTSAADLLKNIPGVYVNSSQGEIRNTVYSRGVSSGSNDGASGYYYVSMQEDGLPVTNATFSNYGPDYFLRTDATLGRLEAVRGGTASILGNNAPGGIFNYVSKTGGDKFSGEIRAKNGLEGNGQNPYYRLDFNFGGPLSKDKSVAFNIGGFWRQNDGDRYSGYPMNKGGQLKANVVKTYKTGNVKIFAKYLNDHNGFNEFLPTIGFTDPKFPAGVTNTTSVLIPSVKADVTINETGKKVHFDSRDLVHSKDASIGLNWEQNLGDGWKIDNKFRYSDKRALWNTTSIVSPFAMDNAIFYGFSGLTDANSAGATYSFNDHATGTQFGSVTNNFYESFTVNKGDFPGASIQPNSLYFHPLLLTDNKMKEIIEQFTITKKLKNMSFTAGAFYASSKLNRMDGAAGVTYSQMTSPHPLLTDISYVGFFDGQTYQMTNKDGIIGGSGGSSAFSFMDAKQKQFALFFGHNWEISSKLNFDWGVRYEDLSYNGSNQIGVTVASTTGGFDGNPLTVYDNNGGAIDAVYNYKDQKINTFSFSGGLNYKYTDNQAVYARYSQGAKAPDLTMFVGINTQLAADNLDPRAQKIQQFELGYKLKTGKTNIFVTPFYSLLSNVGLQVQGQEGVDLTSLYYAPTLYNKYRTVGVELEANQEFTEKFSVRAVATFQNSKAVEYKTWDLGENGAADDKTVDFSGNKTDNSAEVILRISPSYTSGKFYSSLDFSYMGKRPANVANAFDLPSYNTSNLNLGYTINKNWQVQGNINNVFNQIAVMAWSAPGGFPASLDRQGFTKADVEANPNATYATMNLPARAFFLTGIYKF